MSTIQGLNGSGPVDQVPILRLPRDILTLGPRICLYRHRVSSRETASSLR